ncbi:ArsR/SmtB family transcription factor [Streptomyces chisholmiae]|uniref:ArsR/SmtB family transcription factor n=1 Tax=Streptomyces chisholmiae TaxID=3075540 RepID=UPI00374E2065
MRVHFDGDDLARVRVAVGAVPAWETVLSLHSLHHAERGNVSRRWRRSVAAGAPRATRLLSELVPPRGYFPDFLTPARQRYGLRESVAEVLRTPPAARRGDIELLGAERAVSPWVRALSRGDDHALDLLGRALTSYQRVAITPHWRHVRAAVEAERERLATELLDRGTESLLGRLAPGIRWRAPVLEMDYPVRQELHLGGRGLLLVPSYFCWRTAVTLLRQDGIPVLVYPAERRGGALAPDGDRRRELAALIGATRTEVLTQVGSGASSGELARRTGALPSSVSQHTAVLRAAGLLFSERRRNAVVHTLTPLGRRLLGGGDGPDR